MIADMVVKAEDEEAGGPFTTVGIDALMLANRHLFNCLGSFRTLSHARHINRVMGNVEDLAGYDKCLDLINQLPVTPFAGADIQHNLADEWQNDPFGGVQSYRSHGLQKLVATVTSLDDPAEWHPALEKISLALSQLLPMEQRAQVLAAMIDLAAELTELATEVERDFGGFSEPAWNEVQHIAQIGVLALPITLPAQRAALLPMLNAMVQGIPGIDKADAQASFRQEAEKVLTALRSECDAAREVPEATLHSIILVIDLLPTSQKRLQAAQHCLSYFPKLKAPKVKYLRRLIKFSAETLNNSDKVKLIESCLRTASELNDINLDPEFEHHLLQIYKENAAHLNLGHLCQVVRLSKSNGGTKPDFGVSDLVSAVNSLSPRNLRGGLAQLRRGLDKMSGEFAAVGVATVLTHTDYSHAQAAADYQANMALVSSLPALDNATRESSSGESLRLAFQEARTALFSVPGLSGGEKVRLLVDARNECTRLLGTCR